AAERSQRRGDRVILDPGRPRRCSGSGRILAIVRAGNERLRGQRIVVRELDALGAAGDYVEAARNDRDVRLGLVLEDAQLRVAIGVIRAVTIEVVRLQVQQDGDARPETVDVLELEARELAHDPRVARNRVVESRQRAADVADNLYGSLRGAEDR